MRGNAPRNGVFKSKSHFPSERGSFSVGDGSIDWEASYGAINVWKGGGEVGSKLKPKNERCKITT